MGMTTFNPLIVLNGHMTLIIRPAIGHNSLFWYNFYMPIYGQCTPFILLLLTFFYAYCLNKSLYD